MFVAGIDSSTQSCKMVVRDADSGVLVRQGRAPHPDGTELDPRHWWVAVQTAITAAGGLDDVGALSVAAQQHGMVCLDEAGDVVRDALLWNDTRSAYAARDLIDELGGADRWAEAVGSVPVAALTITKLRWLAQHEPVNADRTAAVCLPHDWLTWRLRGSGRLDELTTDRSDASGTGYWGPDGRYRTDLLELAFGRRPRLPRVLAATEAAGVLPGGGRVGPGAGDNAAAALGVRATAGDVIVSIGTSGVVSAVSRTPTADASGIVSGFASATGDYLPLVCTLNAARVLDAAARLLGVTLTELSTLALSAPPGADGLTVVPYLEGERTPNRPNATGAVHGWRTATSTPAHLARATVEGLLCGLADGLDALIEQGIAVGRIMLIGGGARSPAVRQIAPAVLGRPVLVPTPGEYVADGAARQAAWLLTGENEPPRWAADTSQRYEANPAAQIRDRYRDVRELTAARNSLDKPDPHDLGPVC